MAGAQPPPYPPAAPQPAHGPVMRTMDTQEVTTWEPRTGFDNFAVKLGDMVTKNWMWIALGYLGLITILFTRESFNTFDIPLLADYRGTFLLMLIVTFLPFVAIIGVAWALDKTEKEPFGALVVTFLLGAVFAQIAIPVNSSWMNAFWFWLAPFLVTGPIEEFAKWLAVRAYGYNKLGFSPIDGAIYGICAGAGFAWIENWYYIFNNIVGNLMTQINIFGGVVSVEAAINDGWYIVLIRGLGSLAHPAWAGISGYYLGLAKLNPQHRTSLIAKGLFIPIVFHGIHNSFIGVMGYFFGGNQAVGYVADVVRLIYVFGTAVFLFFLMKKYNDYHVAVHAPAQRYQQYAPAPAVAGPGYAAAPQQDAFYAPQPPQPVTLRPNTPPPPPPAPAAVVGGGPATPAHPAALAAVDRAKAHLAAIRGQAQSAGRGEWVQWAETTGDYVARTEAAIRGSTDAAEVARLQAELEASVLNVRFQ